MRSIAAAVVAVACVAAPAAAQMSSLADLDRDFLRIVEQVAPAVVQVEPGISGVCISEDGYILTDGLVAKAFAKSKSGTVKVTFSDQQSYDARLLAADAPTRTVVLAIDTRRRLPSVVPGDPGGLKVGNFLLTVGNAFGLAAESEPSVTLGVVSAVHRDTQGNAELLETSAATNPGQNGGPYFDTEGKLVGLARGLPNAQDLARVTPIDRVRAAYRDVEGTARLFERPMSLRPRRSKAGILSAAFHIGASRARPLVATLVVTRAPPEEPDEAEAGDDAPADAEKDEEPAPRNKKGRKKRGERDAPKPKKPRKATPPPIPPREGPVTGTIVHPDGFVIAPAAPFTEDVASVEAILSDGRRFPASVVARDRKAGFALLLLDRRPTDVMPTLDWVPQDELQLGQFVLAVGAPHQPAPAGPFVTVGMLSARHRMNAYLDALQTDAGVNVKNAGGALVDLAGRLLGVVLPPTSQYGQNSGLGFVMPIEVVRATLPRLMKGQDNEPAYIGAGLADAAGGGVMVSSVTDGFPGAKAGLRAGDVITHLDGQAIADRRGLTDFLWMRKAAGDGMDATVRRDGEVLELHIVLTKRP